MPHSQPPHHPVKLPVVAFATVLGVVALGLASADGNWVGAMLSALAVLFCLLTIRAIRAGRNPWWKRGWLDRRASRDG